MIRFTLAYLTLKLSGLIIIFRYYCDFIAFDVTFTSLLSVPSSLLWQMRFFAASFAAFLATALSSWFYSVQLSRDP